MAHFPSVRFINISSVDSRIFSISAFLAPLIIRALPELLMREYIVGFDTIAYYVPITFKWVNHGVGFWEFFGTAPLLYILLSGLTLAGVPLIVSLKVLPPILHGLLGFAIFKYATKSLAWAARKGLFVSLLATLYFVGLRISWDMLRSELGLIFLFIFLIMLRRCSTSFKWRWAGILTLSAVLVVLAHQLVSVIMFVIMFVITLERLIKQDYFFVKRIFVACLPVIVLFFVTVYADYVVLPAYASELAASSRSEWLNLMSYSSIPYGIIYTAGFLLFCYFPILPFAALKIRKLKGLELKVWAFWCLIGASLPFLSDLAPLSYRWILLLHFPLAFFAVESFEKLNYRLVKEVVAGFMVLLSVSFVFLPHDAAFPYLSLYPFYVPSSMLQNTVPLSDCGDVIKVINWFKINVNSSSVLLVHDAFHGWVLFYAGDVKVVCYGYASPDEVTLHYFSQHDRSKLYLIWWSSGVVWHGYSVRFPFFNEVFCSGRISIYEIVVTS